MTDLSSDFLRLEQIFGIDSSKKKQKSPATPVTKSRKRKSLPKKRTPAVPIRKVPRFSESPDQKTSKPSVIISPDKRDILPHLSCNAEDFEKDLIANSDDSKEDLQK
jgi:hypothetical protein